MKNERTWKYLCEDHSWHSNHEACPDCEHARNQDDKERTPQNERKQFAGLLQKLSGCRL